MLQVKKKPAEEKPVKETPRGWDLVLLFMTPWRNPNSIFIYMFLTIEVLSKVREMTK